MSFASPKPFPLIRIRKLDPVWIVAILSSLGLNLVVAYGYASAIGNGSWNKALVCPRECKTPRLPVTLTLEEAKEALPPPPPEVKAEETPVSPPPSPPSPAPAQPAAMSPIVIPPLEEPTQPPPVVVPPPEVLSPIYVQQPPEAPLPAPEGTVAMEAPAIAVPLPAGHVPWARKIGEDVGSSLVTALTQPGEVHVAAGATGPGLGTAPTGSDSGQPHPTPNLSSSPIGAAAPVSAPPTSTEPWQPLPPPRPAAEPEKQPEPSPAAVEPPPPPAVAPASPSEPEKPKGPTRPPRLTHRVEPAYPSAAKQLGLEGSALVRALVSASGSVADASLVESSGHQMLDDAALAAVRKWKFSPALKDGVAVEEHVKVRVRFKIVD